MTSTLDTTTASPVTGATPAVAAFIAAVTIVLAATASPARADWAVRKEETLHRTFTLAAAPAGGGTT
ncbi:MAG TPA: hypothetical protein VN999_07355, partial [Thermoanaerobaculia bacterium]|nr:hypothetical protein [Thermoanaerobaculia bacterium]